MQQAPENPTLTWQIVGVCILAISAIVSPLIFNAFKIWKGQALLERDVADLKDDMKGVIANQQRDREMMIANFAAINAKMGIAVKLDGPHHE